MKEVLLGFLESAAMGHPVLQKHRRWLKRFETEAKQMREEEEAKKWDEEIRFVKVSLCFMGLGSAEVP